MLIDGKCAGGGVHVTVIHLTITPTKNQELSKWQKSRMEVPLLSILFSVSSWLVVSRVCWGTLGARRGQWQGGDDESSQLLDTNCALRSGPGMHKQPQKKVEMAKVIIYL